MISKNSDNAQWTDPKDYGLPYVEITPINPVNFSQETKQEISKISQNPEPAFEVVQPLPDSIGSKDELISPPEKVDVEPIEKKVDSEKKSSNSWVWIVAILAIAIVGVIIFQIQKETNSEPTAVVPIDETAVAETNQNQESSDLENTPSQEIQDPDNQQIIADTTSNQIPPSQTPQSGTTIESNEPGTLVRIESKKDRPQYFIVVGSLPSESLAIKEAAQYYDRAQILYLILPYDDVRNYRLAIGPFGSFSSASAELESAKGRYTDALWILKY